jgi:hypothetical protein
MNFWLRLYGFGRSGREHTSIGNWVPSALTAYPARHVRSDMLQEMRLVLALHHTPGMDEAVPCAAQIFQQVQTLC